nr:UDP-N-acetylglucosamine 2-epimerase (hydrolyzing) [Planctomycetota bacterium]
MNDADGIPEKRKVCVVLVDRANYGRLKPVMEALRRHRDIHLQVLCGGTMVLERFQSSVQIVRGDGFDIDGEIYMELEGSTPVTMAKSAGIGIIEFSNHFQRLKPDVVVLIGDRYEALSAAIAAAYMNICLVHLQGGEISGSIDESARHAITKFAHYHVPATVQSADYLVRLGERPETIIAIGCPSGDIARKLDRTISAELFNARGTGCIIEPRMPFILSIFHPTTTEFGGEREQMEQLLHALDELAMPTLMLWPNIDAGSDHIAKMIRAFRERHRPQWLRLITNLAPEDFQRALSATVCAVGNSSSFVRDAGHFGTPVVLVGARQNGREHDVNAIHADPIAGEIAAQIRKQLEHGRYPASTLYGDGYVSE